MPAFDTAGVNLTPLYFAKFTFSEMLSIGQTTSLPLEKLKISQPPDERSD